MKKKGFVFILVATLVFVSCCDETVTCPDCKGECKVVDSYDVCDRCRENPGIEPGTKSSPCSECGGLVQTPHYKSCPRCNGRGWLCKEDL